MTAIAPNAHAHADNSRHFAPPVAQPATGDRYRPVRLVPDAASPSPAVRTPWRDPLFYLSFVAMAVLLCAVGILLLYRVAVHRRRA